MTYPLWVGGSTTRFGSTRGRCAGSATWATCPLPRANDNEACLLHFDAHTDAYHNIPNFLGAVKSTAHWAAYLVEGFGIDQVTDLIRSVRGRNVIGGDVVCLMPTVDSPNAITSYRAMAVMFEIISLIVDGAGA